MDSFPEAVNYISGHNITVQVDDSPPLPQTLLFLVSRFLSNWVQFQKIFEKFDDDFCGQVYNQQSRALLKNNFFSFIYYIVFLLISWCIALFILSVY